MYEEESQIQNMVSILRENNLQYLIYCFDDKLFGLLTKFMDTEIRSTLYPAHKRSSYEFWTRSITVTVIIESRWRWIDAVEDGFFYFLSSSFEL